MTEPSRDPVSAPAAPRVSVLVTTYNHEAYVRQALASVARQDRDFEVEVIVADDHSLDATAALVEALRADLPGLRLLRSERNLGITRNLQRGFAACRGEYVAVLEGDDYWTSDAKLRTQATFLDGHPECVLCFHRLLIHEERDGTATPHPNLETPAGFALLTARQLARGNFIGNMSVCMYRRDALARVDPGLFELRVYDWILNIVVARQGLIGYLPEIMSVYRRHAGGAWTGLTREVQLVELLALIDVYNRYLDFEFDAEFQAFAARIRDALRTLRAASAPGP